MNTTNMIKSFFILIVFIAFTACKKGDDGINGTPGKNGNANVSSRTFKVPSWAYSAPSYYANLTVPELTAANHNSSGVMVYFSTTLGGHWIALPYTQVASPENYLMGFSTSTGTVKVTWTYDTELAAGDDPNKYYNQELQFKVVVIPPAERMLKPSVNLTDYNKVKEEFGLTE